MISSPPSRTVFVTGGTGYLGSRLIRHLATRGHEVHALVRPESAGRLPAGCAPVTGDALHGVSYAGRISPADSFVHLVGVSHPSPARASQFLSVDLASIVAAVPAAVTAGVKHFVYVSVAQPAPAMKAYVAARARSEVLIRESGLNATIIRPWYVLGPGHWWPVVLLPGYWIAGLLPATRAAARRLGLVTIAQMLRALLWAVENPVNGVRVIEVPDIRNASLA